MKNLPHRTRISLVSAVAVVCAGILAYLPPIPQDPFYHDFADHRGWWGIPNFGDVASNLPFIAVGVVGLFLTWQKRLSLNGYAAWLIFFFGVFLTGFGSGYYHLSPNNHTLVWDRLPMTIAFMSLFSGIIAERVDRKVGERLLPVLLIMGMTSVWYWNWTETAGQGDLRPYVFVQFFPILVLPMVLLLFSAKQGGRKYLVYTLGWYLLAKILEHFDVAVFYLTGGVVSGHTLKHPAAAVATACVLLYMRRLAGSSERKT